MKLNPALALLFTALAVPAYGTVNLDKLEPLSRIGDVQSRTVFSSTKRSAAESGVTLIMAKTGADQQASFFGAELPGITYLFAETQNAGALLIGWQGIWAFPSQDAAMASPAFKELKAALEKQTQSGPSEGQFTDGTWQYSLAVGSLKDGRGVLMLGAQAKTREEPAK